MLFDSQGQPEAPIIRDQQFISFFCHGHVFQLKPTAHGLHALFKIDKMVKGQWKCRLIFMYCAKFEKMESALIICVLPHPPYTLFQFIEIAFFCTLLYLYKRKNVKHIVIVMLLVALLGMNKGKLYDWGRGLWIKPF